MNHRIATLKLRSAALAACGSLVACSLWACSGDDTAQPPADDGGSEGSTTTPDGGTDAKVDSTAPVTDAASDARLGDVAVTDVRVTLDAGDAGDATVVVEAGRDGGDGGAADADAASAPLAPLDLCPTLDTDYGITSTGDRALTWGSDISGSGASNFATALTNDCRVNGMLSVINGSGANGSFAYLDQLDAFTLQFFGCAADPDAGTVSFSGLIPAGAANHTFTMADLNVLSSLYTNATIAQASLNWATNYPNANMQPLTADQIDQIQAQLAGLAAMYPGTNPSTTHLTYSTCPSDAGTDASDSGGDASAEAAADASSD